MCWWRDECAFFIVSKKNDVLTALRPKKSFLDACSKRNGFQSLVSTCLPCASPRSEHGILGKRRVKLRSPAVGRTPRGCQPDEQIRPRLSGTLWSAAVRVRGSRAQRRGRGTAELTSIAGITPVYWPAFALRGRPLSAALSSPAPAARVRWPRSTDYGRWSAPTHTRPQTRKRMGAWSVAAPPES